MPKGWIDLAVGEARVVRQALLSIYPQDLFSYNDLWDCDYQPPSGYPPLVKFLEEKHGCRVLVTNGAKQALCAVFHAVKQQGLNAVAMRSPYWSKAPSPQLLATAIAQGRGIMSDAYSIDLGVTADGQTLLVEVNEGYTLGGYGLASVVYARFLETRWEQFVRSMNTTD